MSQKIVYRMNVYVTMPLTDDPDNPDLHTVESATDAFHKRYVERSLFNCLKRFKYECDVELMDYTVEDE